MVPDSVAATTTVPIAGPAGGALCGPLVTGDGPHGNRRGYVAVERWLGAAASCDSELSYFGYPVLLVFNSVHVKHILSMISLTERRKMKEERGERGRDREIK